MKMLSMSKNVLGLFVFVAAALHMQEVRAASPVLGFLNAKDVRPGLCIQVGCGDGALTAALYMDGRYVVHAIAADRAAVGRARSAVEAKGVYGPVADGSRCTPRSLPRARPARRAPPRT